MAKYVVDIDTENPYVDKNGNKVYVATSGAIYEHVVMKGLEPLTPEYVKERFKGLLDCEYEKGLTDGRKQGEESGYKKCLSENDFDSPCVSCDNYNKGLEDAWG